MNHPRNISCLWLTALLMASAAPGLWAQIETNPVQEKPAAPFRAGPDDPIQLNFRDASVDAVLDHLSEVAGLIILKPATIPGRITLVSLKPVSVQEAIQALHSVLKEKGFAAIRTGRILKIVPLAQAPKSNVPVFVGADPEKIAETDEIITQIVHLRSVEAAQLMKDLQPLLSSPGAATANANSNSLVITDTSANIRRIVRVIAAIDLSQTGKAEVKVFPLKYARASEAARLITQTFGGGANASRGQSGRGGGGQGGEAIRAFFEGRGGGGGGNEQGDQAGAGPRSVATLTASADDRTNTVVVSGPPEILTLVAKVLQDLDSNPTATQGVFIYKVINGQAANLEQVLNGLFGTNTNRTNTSGTGAGAGSRPGAGTGGRGSSEAQPPGGAPAAPTNPFQPGGGRGAFFDAMRQGFAAQASQQTAQTAGDLYGQVYVTSDADSNSLLVMTAPGNFEQVRKIIEELDTPVPQVLIKVLIAEITHSNSLDLGVEFSALNAPGTSSFLTSFGVAAATGGAIYTLDSGDISATLRAMEEVGKLEVLSRPYILASNNQESTITVGSEVPFVTNTQFTELGGTRNTVRYEDVGIILIVTPHISADGKVTMDIAPEISAISGETVQVSDTVFLPVIEKRSASTRVAINDGQTIVIGGLMEDKKTATIDKVPLLGDIPGLGLLFQRQDTEKRKTELLIFLTPHVAKDPGELPDMTKEELEGTQIVPNAVSPGEYQRHIRGLQRGSGNAPPEPPPGKKIKNPTLDPNEIDVDLPGTPATPSLPD